MGSGQHIIALVPRYVGAARRLIDRERVATPDERAAAVRTIENIFVKLSPLVGTLGVLALFARSVSLARRDRPSLAGLVVATSSLDGTQERLRSHFGAAPNDDSATVLCATFITLLVTFIGEELTLRLIEQEVEKKP